MPPSRKNQLKDPLRTWRRSQRLSSPIYDRFWCDSNQDITNRLDLAARRLKEKRAAQLQDNKEDDMITQDTPNLGKSCSLCEEPLGNHVLQCTRENLQDTLKEVTHSNPAEPLTGPPKVVHPFPQVSPQALLPPSPRNSGPLLCEVELGCQDAHRSPSKEAQMLTTMTTQPRVVLKRLSLEEIQSLTSSA